VAFIARSDATTAWKYFGRLCTISTITGRAASAAWSVGNRWLFRTGCALLMLAASRRIPSPSIPSSTSAACGWPVGDAGAGSGVEVGGAVGVGGSVGGGGGLVVT
jgi:hypothetical protein